MLLCKVVLTKSPIQHVSTWCMYIVASYGKELVKINTTADCNKHKTEQGNNQCAFIIIACS